MYDVFYQLTAKPFQLSPDPRFFFGSKGHKRALAYLRYGVKQGEGFIIVTGDIGTGKSILISALFQSLAKEHVIAAQVVTTQMQEDDLLRFVASGFGLAYQQVSKAEVLRSLEAFFRNCVREGKRILLVVDEAQNLPKRSIEELRMLSNFQAEGKPLLQSFLLGQKEFRNTIRSEGFEQLRQRVIAAYHLQPLDAAETKGYIEHRLRRAGWNGDPSVSDEVYGGIYRFTGGIPRRINTLCDRLLLYGALEELHSIEQESLTVVIQDIVDEQGLLVPNQQTLSALQGLPEVPGLSANGSGSPQGAVKNSTAVEGSILIPAQGRPGYARNQDERLSALESSVAALTDVMREEMALLRKALVGKVKKEEDVRD